MEVCLEGRKAELLRVGDGAEDRESQRDGLEVDHGGSCWPSEGHGFNWSEMGNL